MIKGVVSIESLCKLGLGNLPGIRSITFTDYNNYDNLGALAPGSDVYSISFSKWSGSYDKSFGTAAAGDFYTQMAKVIVPRYRYTCEKLVAELMDRKVIAFVTDTNGDEHTLVGARFRSNFQTGTKPGDKAGYEWTFTGQTANKSFLKYFESVLFSGGDGYIENDDTTFEYEGAGPTPGGLPEACCITVLTTPIEYTPTGTGNLLHKNKVVTVAATGDKYFIDKNGIAILLSQNGFSKERVEGTGAHIYTLSTTYAEDRVLVNRTQNVLYPDTPTLTRVDTFHIDGDQLILPEEYPLEPGDYIEIYKTAS